MWQKYKRNLGISICKIFYGVKSNNHAKFGVKNIIKENVKN